MKRECGVQDEGVAALRGKAIRVRSFGRGGGAWAHPVALPSSAKIRGCTESYEPPVFTGFTVNKRATPP